MWWFEIAHVALGLAVLGVLVYYLVLAAASFWPRRRFAAVAPQTCFTILIPAQNEEKVIARTFTSISALNYPEDQLRVVVIADNCTDRTAEITREGGFECLVRDDPHNQGKGQAISWALAQIMDSDHAEAYVIVDADSVVESELLTVLSGYIQRGGRAIQVYHDVLEPGSSPMASFTFLGYSLSRNLKYAGRSRLGLSSNLLGNGMCFTRDVLKRVEWNAFSITEDGEYQILLCLAGIRVQFAREVRVWGEIPSKPRAWHRQQSRWVAGKSHLRRDYLPALLRRAFRHGDLAALDLALELSVPSYSVLALLVLASVCLQLIVGGTAPTPNLLLWGALAGGFGLYTLTGLLVARPSLRVCGNLLLAPLFLAWRLGIRISTPFRRNMAWIKSAR